MATALVAGTTGLVGSQVLALLLQDESYDRVVALSRKPLSVVHPKLQNLVLDFDSLTNYMEQLKADDIFCCLGTTIRQAGTKEAFRKVDFEIPLALAKACHAQGARQYLLITALGSDKRSAIFYNRVKGEVEEAIRQVGFECLHIFQPSMLLGNRKDQRAGESAGKIVMKALDFIIPKNYKAIDSARLAKAMLAIARRRQEGVHVHPSGELQNF